MSKLNLGLYILALYVIFIVHKIQGGKLHPTIKKAWYEQVFPSNNDGGINYFATHETAPASYFGLVAIMDVYGHNISDGRILTGIWIHNRQPDPKIDVNAIWVGWQVWPRHYGDSRTHFFTTWTRDSYRTGCYDMACPAFQLASGSKIVPGTPIKHASDVNGKRQKITIKIFREKSTGNWWIHYGFNKAPRTVRYYLAKLFNRLGKVTDIGIGSVVVRNGDAPSPPMGSGFPQSDKAATITDISFITEDGRIRDASTEIRDQK
ncbi:hypothetical protein BRADI_1g05192v3 [Brachypodium distachyon]|uniref:Neprosin PEP catalytic domain-containing protein n=2 Tax=Brachypodium distachyon TaxID=15368 RepID=A0A2K2DI58_BRADI|nr:hypothetical protein BRADI_1g05192v3 [Brachypodium distachyon]